MRAEVELLLLEEDPGVVRHLCWPLAMVDEGQRRWRAAGRRPEKTEEEAGVGGAPAAVVEEGPRRWPAAPANPKSRGGLLEEEAREDGGCRWSGSAMTVVLPVKRVLDGAALEWGDDGGGRE